MIATSPRSAGCGRTQDPARIAQRLSLTERLISGLTDELALCEQLERECRLTDDDSQYGPLGELTQDYASKADELRRVLRRLEDVRRTLRDALEA